MEILLMLLFLGVVGLVVAGVAVAVFGMLFGLAFTAAGFLVFKVLPILLVGWLVVKLISRSRDRSRISSADQRWLDSE